MATSVAFTGAAALTAATAAYLDAKYHISHDIIDTLRVRASERQFAQAAAQNRRCLWYFFEEQVERLPAGTECLWSRTGRYTWQQTYDNACRYAQFFLSQGIQPGQLVAVFLMNSPEFVFSYLGSWAIGSAPALINYNLVGDALIHCLRMSGSKVVLVDEDAECRSRIEDARDRIENELGMKVVILDKQTRERLAGLSPVRPEDELRANVKPEFPMCLLYTSGTTGMPKACPFQVQRAWHVAEYRMKTHGLKRGPTGPRDRMYDTMPFYHGTGNTVVAGCMMTGVTLCIGRKFSVSRFWDDIRDSEATAFVYVGETARYLLNAPPSPRDRDHKIHLMYGNGLRPDVWLKFRDRFGIETISEFFNSTEGVFSLANVNRNNFTACAVGHQGGIKRWQDRDRFVPVAIDHEKGDIWRDPKTGFATRTSYDQGGELIVRIPHESVFGGYWNAPEATEKKFLRNVFRTGDLYYRTGDALRRSDDGHWYFLDRLGDTFRWKGENVSTAEVAECLGQFAGVQEANVYGVELPSHDGRAGCAAIYIAPEQRGNFDLASLLTHARRVLPRYAVPVFLRVLEQQQLGHNNKQNKVPLRNEGVDPKRVAEGQAGPRDALYWAAPTSSSYVPFKQADWDSLVAGKARL